MKKNLRLAAMMLGMTILVAGCGNSKSADNTESTGTTVTDYSEYVTLGEYKGIEVSLDSAPISTEVTQEDIDAEIQSILQGYASNVEITDRDVIENGDIANIDYKGTKDGVAFEGGTAEGYDLEIGSGTFIEGFEEGLIGVKVGETVNLDLTFPEEYPAEDLAGQAVVFEVTVNSISESVVPELTEEFVTTNTDYDSIEAFETGISETLQKNKESMIKSQKQAAVWNTVRESATINDYPEELVNKYIEQVNTYYSGYAQQYEMELDEFMTTYFGSTVEEYAKSVAEEEMIFNCIAAKENINVTDEDVNAAAEELAPSYGYENAEAFLEAYTVEEIRSNLIYEKVMEFLVENSVVK